MSSVWQFDIEVLAVESLKAAIERRRVYAANNRIAGYGKLHRNCNIVQPVGASGLRAKLARITGESQCENCHDSTHEALET